MNGETIIPFSCNHFGIGTNNGQTFIFEFRFQEPPTEEGKPGKIHPFARIAIDRIGAKRFLKLLEKTLNDTKKVDQDTPSAPSGEFML